MSILMITEREEKERKVKAILSIKYGLDNEGSLKFWHNLTIAKGEENENL